MKPRRRGTHRAERPAPTHIINIWLDSLLDHEGRASFRRAESGFLDRSRSFVRLGTLVDAIPGRLTIVCCSNTILNLICARSDLPIWA